MNLPDHHRRSIRLKGYDYTQPGAYFVTICAFQREEIFGTVINDVIRLSPIGKIVQAEWFHSAEIRQEIRLFEDEFVVMPNHIHGIVWIVENEIVGADGVRPQGVRPQGVRPQGVRPQGVRPGGNNPDARPRIPHTANSATQSKGATHAGATHAGATHAGATHAGATHAGATHAGASLAPLQRAARSLSSFIAGYKAAVTSRAGRELNAANIWQRNYYEHIVRNDEDLKKIWNYINTNLLHWEQDQLHPSALPNRFNQDNL